MSWAAQHPEPELSDVSEQSAPQSNVRFWLVTLDYMPMGDTSQRWVTPLHLYYYALSCVWHSEPPPHLWTSLADATHITHSARRALITLVWKGGRSCNIRSETVQRVWLVLENVFLFSEVENLKGFENPIVVMEVRGGVTLGLCVWVFEWERRSGEPTNNNHFLVCIKQLT